MKLIFLGSPQFAVTVLQALLNSRHTVAAVVCQPDKIGNRNKLQPCAVKQFAIASNLPVFDFKNINDIPNTDLLDNIQADVLVTAAYGQMLSERVLNLKPYGVINVHGSLLPQYRGASPIQQAIIDGQTQTGVTIVKSVKKMDAGPVLSQATALVPLDATADTMFDTLACLGSQLLVDTLDALQADKVVFTPQKELQATYCKKITAQYEVINWDLPASVVSNHIRGLSSTPGAYTIFNGQRLKIFNCKQTDAFSNLNLTQGQIYYTKKQMIVGCKDSAVELLEVQQSNGKRLKTTDFLNGLKLRPTQMESL